MGRPRKTRSDLPERVYLQGRTYRYAPPNGVPINLGQDLFDALKEYNKITAGALRKVQNVAQLIDLYMVKWAAVKKAPRTYHDNLIEAQNLKLWLGHFVPEELEPPHIRTYMDGRGAPIRANREKALLSAVYSWGIERGHVRLTYNPCRLVKRNPESRRERVPSMDEIAAFQETASPLIAAYTEFKYQTGFRKGDILKLRPDLHFTEEGIDLKTGKKGNRLVVYWSDDLRVAVANLKLACARISPNPKKRTAEIASFYLVHTRRGQPYTDSGFDALWQHAMVKAMAAGKLKERFHEHDLRAATAMADKANAQDRLGHKNASSTDAYLRSKQVAKVHPIKKV